MVIICCCSIVSIAGRLSEECPNVTTCDCTKNERIDIIYVEVDVDVEVDDDDDDEEEEEAH